MARLTRGFLLPESPLHISLTSQEVTLPSGHLNPAMGWEREGYLQKKVDAIEGEVLEWQNERQNGYRKKAMYRSGVGGGERQAYACGYGEAVYGTGREAADLVFSSGGGAVGDYR